MKQAANIYRLFHSPNGYFIAVKAIIGMSGELFFWQQISPFYSRRYDAERWADKNNKPLINSRYSTAANL